jgi:hypothetical protein
LTGHEVWRSVDSSVKLYRDTYQRWWIAIDRIHELTDAELLELKAALEAEFGIKPE